MQKDHRLFPGYLLVVLFCAGALQAQPFRRKTEATPAQPLAGQTQLLWNDYLRAIYDSSVYLRSNVRPLRPLTPDEHGLVIVATATNEDATVGSIIPASADGTWVTGVPEVQTICRAFRGDVEMQVRQLLGLPPDADAPRVLVLQVSRNDLFRPSPDDRIDTKYPCDPAAGGGLPSDCGNVFPASTTPAHYQWIATQSFLLHSVPNGYPWTHLGYTYNWAPHTDRYGASEYVVRGNAKMLVVGNFSTTQYCAPPPAP